MNQATAVGQSTAQTLRLATTARRLLHKAVLVAQLDSSDVVAAVLDSLGLPVSEQ